MGHVVSGEGATTRPAGAQGPATLQPPCHTANTPAVACGSFSTWSPHPSAAARRAV